jgi:hypothetical protein
MEHTMFAWPKVVHTHEGTACTMACLMHPCNCLVNKWYKSFCSCVWFLQIARPNIPNKPSFPLVLSCPYHTRRMESYVWSWLTPCLQYNLCKQPCFFDLGTARVCTQRNTGCPPRFGNNHLGNCCTFQCRVHLEIFRGHILDRL